VEDAPTLMALQTRGVGFAQGFGVQAPHPIDCKIAHAA
jgi:EAL domain-containing protein (putative c-di-GMP-specific phosphodiesterase class I)